MALLTAEQFGIGDTLPIVRVDIDAEEIDRFRRLACALVGDARETVRALIVELRVGEKARAPRNVELTAA